MRPPEACVLHVNDALWCHPKEEPITLTDLFLDCAQLVEGPSDLNSNSHFQKTTKDKNVFATT